VVVQEAFELESLVVGQKVSKVVMSLGDRERCRQLYRVNLLVRPQHVCETEERPPAGSDRMYILCVLKAFLSEVSNSLQEDLRNVDGENLEVSFVCVFMGNSE